MRTRFRNLALIFVCKCQKVWFCAFPSDNSVELFKLCSEDKEPEAKLFSVNDGKVKTFFLRCE